MSAHGDVRTGVEKVLDEAGLKAKSYVGDTLAAPAVVVVPGQPYIAAASRSSGIPFGRQSVRVEVLCLVGLTQAKKSAAQRIDELVNDVLTALSDEYDVTEVSRPGELTLDRSKFLGSVVSIEEITEAP